MSEEINDLNEEVEHSETNEATEELGDKASTESPQSGLEGALAAAQEQAARNQEQYLRAVADLDNYRKRAQRERQELHKRATANVLEALLPVLDSMQMGLASARKHEEAASVVSGFEMVAQQLDQVLEAQGLETINPKGEVFDPNLHDCVAQHPSEDAQEGTILEVTRIGYRLNGYLLRPASVVVAGK